MTLILKYLHRIWEKKDIVTIPFNVQKIKNNISRDMWLQKSKWILFDFLE